MIIVTGASRGIGKAISEHLSKQGEKVIGISRSKFTSNIESFECNVGDYSSVKDVARQVKRMKQPLKAVINAAGVASMNMAVTTDEKTVQKLVQEISQSD